MRDFITTAIIALAAAKAKAETEGQYKNPKVKKEPAHGKKSDGRQKVTNYSVRLCPKYQSS